MLTYFGVCRFTWKTLTLAHHKLAADNALKNLVLIVLRVPCFVCLLQRSWCKALRGCSSSIHCPSPQSDDEHGMCLCIL